LEVNAYIYGAGWEYCKFKEWTLGLKVKLNVLAIVTTEDIGYDYVDESKVIRPTEIVQEQADYVIIAVKKWKEVKSLLLTQGITEEKIVFWQDLKGILPQEPPAPLETYNNSTLFLSFGENCLTDDILRRHNLKSFSTPYSWGRSNVEYILQMEKDNFREVFNTDKMSYGLLDNVRLLRLEAYKSIKNKYTALNMNGFEFTHHDILADSSEREKMERRCKRLLSLNKSNRLFIVYHHRMCRETNKNLLICHLQELRNLYLERCSEVEVILFTQQIVDDDNLRRIEYGTIQGIHQFVFYTKTVWGGKDAIAYWARCDEDLIKKMIEKITELASR